VLLMTGFFNLPISRPEFLKAAAAASLLGFGGTALASILFYMLVKRAGALFSSMVTYGIPFVAIAWGAWYGEHISLLQLLSLAVILMGVFLANR
jgi:drug/metabolite transporter (DMT)-like permease